MHTPPNSEDLRELKHMNKTAVLMFLHSYFSEHLAMHTSHYPKYPACKLRVSTISTGRQLRFLMDLCQAALASFLYQSSNYSRVPKMTFIFNTSFKFNQQSALLPETIAAVSLCSL